MKVNLLACTELEMTFVVVKCEVISCYCPLLRFMKLSFLLVICGTLFLMKLDKSPMIFSDVFILVN